MCLLAVLSLAARAQSTNKVQFSFGPDAGVVTGALSKSHTAVLGGSLQVGLPLNKKLYFTAASGYNYFFGKQNVGEQLEEYRRLDYIGVKSVPAKLGLKYYINRLWYVQGEGGAVFFSGTPQSFYEAGTAFVYAPQIGFELPMGSHSFNASLRFESTLPKANKAVNVSFFGLNVGIGF